MGLTGLANHIRRRAWRSGAAGDGRRPCGQWCLRGRRSRYLRSRIMQGRKLDFEREQRRLFGRGESVLRGGCLQAGRIEPADDTRAPMASGVPTLNPKAKTNLVPTGIGKFGIFLLCGRLVRRADRRKSHRFRRGAGDLSAFRNHADQHQWRLALGPHGGSALSDSMASDSTGNSPMSCNGRSRHSVRPAPQTLRAWFGRDFRPACAIGRTRFSPSMSSMDAISLAKTPTGSLSERRSAFRRRRQDPRASAPAIYELSCPDNAGRSDGS